MHRAPLLLCAVLGWLTAVATGCGSELEPVGSRSGHRTGAVSGADGWQRLPDGPLTGRVGSTVVGLDEHHAMVVGGWQWLCPPGADCPWPDTPMLADGAIVDLRTGEWRAVADAPYGFRHAAGAAVAGQLYLWTGCRSGPGCEGPAELLRYDVAADRWHQAAGPPDPGAWVSALVPVGRRLLAVSASDEAGEVADQLYDPVLDRWVQLPDDPLPAVYDRFAAVDGDRVRVFGSVDGGPVKVGAAYDLRTRGWSRQPDAPAGGYQAWRIGDQVWLNGHGRRDRSAVLDLGTGAWRPLPAGPPADEVDLAGVVGAGEAAYAYDHGWVRDVVAARWVQVPDRAPTTYDEAVAAVGSALVVAGGQDWEAEPGGRLVADVWVWRPPRT